MLTTAGDTLLIMGASEGIGVSPTAAGKLDECTGKVHASAQPSHTPKIDAVVLVMRRILIRLECLCLLLPVSATVAR